MRRGRKSSQLQAPLWVDKDNARVWQGDLALALTPTPFATLCYLIEHASQLVSKDELLSAVWRGSAVSEDALIACIRRIRIVLGDTARKPCYIETVPRRGYRFIGPLTTAPLPVQSSESAFPNPHSPIHLVGRAAELTRLHEALNKALTGERQIVFLTGELGIGKTMLIDAFIGWAAAQDQLVVVRGQCVEHYGPGEAYLPLLTALARLCRETTGSQIIDTLRGSALTWLVQLTTAVNASERAMFLEQLSDNSCRRMLREFGAFQ